MSNHMYSCPFWPDGSKGPHCSCNCEQDEPCSQEHLTDVTVALEPTIENPFAVRNAQGRLLGSAVVTLAQGMFNIRFILDAQNPEAFDLANEVKRCRVDMQATLTEGTLKGGIILTSK